MADRIAIITGNGSLSEEIMRISEESIECYCNFVFEAGSFRPFQKVSQFVLRSERRIGINPVKFSEIERNLVNNNIRKVFFAGDFSRTRYFEAYLRLLANRIEKIADRKCKSYLKETSSDLSYPIRLLISLDRFLKDLDIQPLLTYEVFPRLNVGKDFTSKQPPPQRIIDQIPQQVINIGRKLELMNRELNCHIQAVIVDNGIIIPSKALSTIKLLEEYGKRKLTKSTPVLYKLPSVETNPALDPPLIGPTTVEQCKNAGIHGIVICEEITILAEKERTLELINHSGMFLYSMPLNQLLAIRDHHFPNAWNQSASINGPPH